MMGGFTKQRLRVSADQCAASLFPKIYLNLGWPGWEQFRNPEEGFSFLFFASLDLLPFLSQNRDQEPELNRGWSQSHGSMRIRI
jgi:hypothetical protein